MSKRIGSALLAVAVLAQCAMTAALCVKAFCPTAEQRLDDIVSRRLAELAREKSSTPEEVREEKKDPIDEGFENIMQFAVNGKTGFETE